MWCSGGRDASAVRTAARAFSMPAALYSQSENEHLCFGIALIQERVTMCCEGKMAAGLLTCRLSRTAKLDLLSLRFPLFSL